MGRNKMTKSRKKKKNYKLRRRVKRTIAALVMIMAIVIAAIPVENLGTMRAAANSEQLTDIDYTKYAYGEPGYDFGADEDILDKLQLTKTKSEEYGGEEVKTYIFAGGTLTEKLLVQQKLTDKNEGIVTGIAGGDTNLVINSDEYLEYIVADKEYMDDVVAALEGEKYTAKATVTTEEVAPTISGVTLNPTKIETKQLEIKTFEVSSSNSGSTNITSSPVSYAGKNPYVVISAADNTGVEDIIKEHSGYADWEGKVAAYNQAMKELKTKLDAFKTKYESATDVSNASKEWEDLKKERDKIESVDEKFEKNFKQLCEGAGGTTDYKSSFLHKTICDRAATEGNLLLKGATLIDAGGGNFVIRMLPDAVSKDQTTDASNHLITGKITVKGIANNAFKEQRDLASVSIPSSVEFIGDRAFYKCTGLATVNIADGSNMELIGAEAFLNANVSNIHFPIKLKQIGLGAFAKSALVTAEFDDKADGNPIVIWPYAFLAVNN